MHGMPLAAQCLTSEISVLAPVLSGEKAIEWPVAVRQPLAPGYTIYQGTSQQQLMCLPPQCPMGYEITVTTTRQESKDRKTKKPARYQCCQGGV